MRVLVAACLVLATAADCARAADPSPATGAATWLTRLQRTTDGLAWSDELVRHDWRLQRRPGTDECRILDAHEGCVLEGDPEACRAEFARLEAMGRIPPLTGDAVLVLHGLGENRTSMRPLIRYLREHLDATVLAVGYASPRAGIDSHGASLGRVIAGLPEATRISFVGHSLGNIVVRRWMHEAAPPDLARVHRMVMLGAPNQGSELAKLTASIWPLSSLAHGAAKDLVLHWPELAKSLAVPACEFGIVAGGKGDGRGFSPLLAGDDDAVVRVAETQLDGARDFLLLPVNHAAMLKDAAVQRATVSFLRTGRFERPDGGTVPRGATDE